MKDFNKYFIVGTNQNALHDTMNGTVTGELIRCKDCKYFRTYYHGEHMPFSYACDRLYLTNGLSSNDFCSRAERKEE